MRARIASSSTRSIRTSPKASRSAANRSKLLGAPTSIALAIVAIAGRGS